MSATYIPALVIKHNNDVFLNTANTFDAVVVGQTMSIPTPGAGGVVDGDYWAVPITDNNVVSGFDFIPDDGVTVLSDTNPQAFHVFRITNRFGDDYYYCVGHSTAATSGSPASCGYIQASEDAECCSATPCVLPDGSDLPVITPCQLMCNLDAAGGKYFAIFALPTLTSNYRYFPYGYFNNVALAAASATGYSTAASLLSFLNSNWSSVGTWSFPDSPSDNILKVTQTSGSGTDTLCVIIGLVNPSA